MAGGRVNMRVVPALGAAAALLVGSTVSGLQEAGDGVSGGVHCVRMAIERKSSETNAP